DYSQPFDPAEEAAHPGSTRTCSVIRRIIQSGFVHAPSDAEPQRYLKRSLPALELEYSHATIDKTVRDVAGVENLPAGIHGAGYGWVDLDGEGLRGVLVGQGSTWFYKRNVSALHDEQAPSDTRAAFEPLDRLRNLPPAAAVASTNLHLLDLRGGGQTDVVQLDGPMPGRYTRNEVHSWDPFVPFASWPDIDWN